MSGLTLCTGRGGILQTAIFTVTVNVITGFALTARKVSLVGAG